MFLINLLNTYLNKTTLKNLLKINITTVFETYKKLYEQIDCFINSWTVTSSIYNGKSLRNLLMTRFLCFIGVVVVIKRENSNRVRNALEKFDLNLQFTIDTLNNFVPHCIYTVHRFIVNPPIQANAPIMQHLFDSLLKLLGSLSSFVVLQSFGMKENFKLNLKISKIWKALEESKNLKQCV